MASSSQSERDLSIVIPARNEENYVTAALESVRDQRFPLDRLEVVVVANGCNDHTAEVIEEFAAKTPELSVHLVREAVAGIARAKNRGAREAVGRYLLFLDADSRAEPNLAQRVIGWVARGYPAGSIRIIADSSDWLDRAFFGLIEWGKGLFNIRAQMLYCSKDLFWQADGFGEELLLAEDRDFLARLQRKGVAVCHVADSWIATSPRRLHSLPLRLGVVTTFTRWTLAHAGIGRRWRY